MTWEMIIVMGIMILNFFICMIPIILTERKLNKAEELLRKLTFEIDKDDSIVFNNEYGKCYSANLALLMEKAHKFLGDKKGGK